MDLRLAASNKMSWVLIWKLRSTLFLKKNNLRWGDNIATKICQRFQAVTKDSKEEDMVVAFYKNPGSQEESFSVAPQWPLLNLILRREHDKLLKGKDVHFLGLQNDEYVMDILDQRRLMNDIPLMKMIEIAEWSMKWEMMVQPGVFLRPTPMRTTYCSSQIWLLLLFFYLDFHWRLDWVSWLSVG